MEMLASGRVKAFLIMPAKEEVAELSFGKEGEEYGVKRKVEARATMR